MRSRLLHALQRVVAMLALTVLIGGAGTVLGPVRAYAVDPVFELDDGALGAVTGAATDGQTESYWVVGEDGPLLLALDRDGETKATVSFRAEPSAIEAAAYRGGRLYVGDIGDADAAREFVTIYLFPNLEPVEQTTTYQAWDFSYPDGPRDAAAMLVDTAGRLFVITTGDGPGIYAAPQEPSRQGINELERVADAPGGVTDATAVSEDRWVLRTADTAITVDATSYEKVGEASLPVDDGDLLTTDLADADSLIAGSAAGTVYPVAAPTSSAPSASASTPAASPPPASEPPPPQEQEPPADESADSARNGTLVAILVASGLAVLAGVAVYLWPGRRREDAAGAGSAASVPSGEPHGTPPEPAGSSGGVLGGFFAADAADRDPDRYADPPGDRDADQQIYHDADQDLDRTVAPPVNHPAGSGAPDLWARPADPWQQPGPAFGAPPPAPTSHQDPADRYRAPGDIEDDGYDDELFEDTIIRERPVGRRAMTSHGGAPAEPAEPEDDGDWGSAAPRRSLGYDPSLWGDESLPRRTDDQG